MLMFFLVSSFFFQAEDGIRDFHVTGVQTCALPIFGILQRLAVQPLARGLVDPRLGGECGINGINISHGNPHLCTCNQWGSCVWHSRNFPSVPHPSASALPPGLDDGRMGVRIRLMANSPASWKPRTLAATVQTASRERGRSNESTEVE